MNTKKWGPGGWVFLHATAANYTATPGNKRAFKLFFTVVGKTLPCKFCRESYTKFISEIPIDPFLEYDHGPFRWLYLIHNRVNDKLRAQGQPIPKNPTYQSVCRKYDKMRAMCNDKKKTCL
jgi:hypothetical protein